MTDEGKYVLHTWTRQSDWKGPTVVGGQGVWFWDEGGRRYLDMSSQAECCNLGHQHPAIVRAIQEQAARLCYVSNSWGALPRKDLAQRIVSIANRDMEQPPASTSAQEAFGRVFFTCDGAEATE